jgi:hypothetical protein
MAEEFLQSLSSQSIKTTEIPIQQENHPLDIVFTYVNNLDLKWYKKALRYKSELKSVRYNFHGEIFFSLQLIQKNMPWVHHIYIIHDEQPFPLHFLSPEFREKVTFIDHQDIIPQEYLPTFNSQIIECFLWKIPNLADYFIYMNDDFFFGKPIHYSDFFTDKHQMKMYAEVRNYRLSIPEMSGPFQYLIDREVSAEVFAQEMRIKHKTYLQLRHVPYSFHRETCKKAYEIFQPYFHKMCSLHKFRRYDYGKFHFKHYLQSYSVFSAIILYSLMMIYERKVWVISLRSMHHEIINVLELNQSSLIDLLHKRPKFFCINSLAPSQMKLWKILQLGFFSNHHKINKNIK